MVDHRSLRSLLRRASFLLLPPLLILISLGLLATQFTEVATNKEILTLTTFAVLLSFSALAFNWSRINTAFISEDILKGVYQAGIDLFLASLLALIAASFAWLQSLPKLPWPALKLWLFALHWSFLLLSTLLFLTAILALIQSVKSADKESDS